MKHILITASGKIYTFYVRDCALCYQTIYGGTIIEDTVTSSEAVTTG